LAQTIGLRLLKAVGDAVPVRLMKRGLLFLTVRLAAMLDERRISVLIRQNRIGKPKDGEAPAKVITSFLQKADEGQLDRMLVQSVILLSIRSDNDGMRVLRDAAKAY
jgi:ParB family chromosome partitioning protein